MLVILRPKLEWETFKVYFCIYLLIFCFQQTDDDNQLNLKVSWIQWSQQLIKKISTIFQHYPRSAGQWHSTPSWPHTFHKRSIMASILFIISGFSWNNIRCFLHYFRPERLRIFKVLNLEKKEKSEVTRLRSRADLNRRPFAHESSVYPPELSASWRMQVEDEIISVTATHYLYEHCTCKRLLRTETKLSFALFE